jgi:hypothetical protein
MKKIILLTILLISLTGCVNINSTSIENLVSTIKQSKLSLTNEYRNGFTYYLPVNMNVLSSDKANEVLTDGNYNYYLYADMISFYNKTSFDYKENKISYKSLNLKDDKASGYLEINQKNDKYLIEIMYNYAKIEVMVDKDKINEAISNSLIVISSIKFNEDIIENMLGKNVLSFSEEEFNIFETNSSTSNFLEIEKEFGTYEGDDIPDYDLVN